MKHAIKISIITINLNNAAGIEKTLESIFIQKNVTSNDFESIVIDGDSRDNSKDVILKYSEKISTFISERDFGIYDAMNKGIKYARGAYLWFLNSGDYLVNENCLSTFIHATKMFPEPDLIYSDIYLLENNKLKHRLQPQNIEFTYLVSRILNHQSYILKRCFFLLDKNFNVNYKIVADWIFLFNLFKKQKITSFKIQEALVIYDNSGISSSSGNLWKEEQQKYLSSIYSAWELKEIQIMARLSSKNYYNNLIKSLGSPIRTKILSFIFKLMYGNNLFL